MAKKIIILDSPDHNRFSVAFWLSAPTDQKPFYAKTEASSAYINITPEELTEIQTGMVIEQVADMSFPSTMTMDTIQSALVAEFDARQSKITGKDDWNAYGTFYDGSTWSK